MSSRPKQKQKVVIRRLPPNLPQEIFLESLIKWHGKFKSLVYEQGKEAKSAAKENVFSRAYIVPSDTETLLDFYKGYNGHKFIDSKGNQFTAIVEFAPFQRWIDLGKKRRADQRMATIATDPDYIAFCESLNTTSKDNVDFGGVDETDIEYLLSRKENQPKSTPLLDSIKLEKARRAEKKARKKESSSSGRMLPKPMAKPYSQSGSQSGSGSKAGSAIRSEVKDTTPLTSSSGAPSKKKRSRKNGGKGGDSPNVSGSGVASVTNSVAQLSVSSSKATSSSGAPPAPAVDSNPPSSSGKKFKLVKKKDQS